MSPGAGFDTERLRVRPAGAHPAAAREIQSVLDGAPGYHELSTGAPAPPDAGADLLAEAEADVHRHVLLLLPAAGGPAAGLLDLQIHWPEPGAAHVRLLLLRETHQGRGFGREALAGLVGRLRGSGLSVVRASVTDENGRALGFWEAVGFSVVERQEGGVTLLERPA